MLLFTAGIHVGLEGVPRAVMSKQPAALDSHSLGQFFYVTAGLASLGWGLAVLILVGRHGLGALLANIWVLQNQFQMQFIGYLNMIGILVLPTFVLRVAGGTSRRLDRVFVVGAILGLLLAGIKAYLVYSVLTSLVVWSVVRPETFKPRYLVGGLLVLLFFFIVYTNRIDVFLMDRFEAQPWFAPFQDLHRPYLYTVGSWPAFENVINGSMPRPPIFGSVVLQPLWKILGDGLGVIEPIPFNLPFTHIGTSFFNVYSMVGEVFWDFGWPGLIVFSVALGFVSARLYVRARSLAFWGNFLVYGIIGYGLFLSNFIYSYRFNVFVMLAYLYVAGFVACRGGVLRMGRTHD
jgi:oligosaccharide repeat unit polymerase